MLSRKGGLVCTVVEAGVDWITATSDNDKGKERLSVFAHDLLSSEARAGNKMKVFFLEGYKGRASGGVAWGENADRVLVRLSGALASRFWSVVADVASNVSRLDLQATCKFDSFPERFAEKIERGVRAYKRKHDSRLTTQLVRHSKKGNTIYVGSRKSARFLRVYDKYKESGQERYRDCLRFELQSQRADALRLAATGAFEPDSGQWASAVVHTHARKVGVIYRWGAAEREVNLVVRPPTDTDRQLSWLRTQVRPVIQRLWAAGHGAAICAALEGHSMPQREPHDCKAEWLEEVITHVSRNLHTGND
jgi:DNA relaxase NicK